MKDGNFGRMEIQERFRAGDRAVVIDEQRKSETMQILQGYTAGKKISAINGRRQIFLNQIRYMDKSAAGVHILLCLILSLMAVWLYKRGAGREDIVTVLMVSAGVLGIVSTAQIGHVFYPGMAELSESCFFNVRQIVALQMFLAGIMNLTVLCLVILFVGNGWKINFIQTGLYLFVPLVAAQCCGLGVLLSEAGRKNRYLLGMTGAFLTVCYLFLASKPGLYTMSALTVWGAAFAVGSLILGIQIKMLFMGIKRGEIICTN